MTSIVNFTMKSRRLTVLVHSSRQAFCFPILLLLAILGTVVLLHIFFGGNNLATQLARSLHELQLLSWHPGTPEIPEIPIRQGRPSGLETRSSTLSD